MMETVGLWIVNIFSLDNYFDDEDDDNDDDNDDDDDDDDNYDDDNDDDVNQHQDYFAFRAFLQTNSFMEKKH